MTDWTVTLDGVTLSGGDEPGVGCLTDAPDGLGLPGLRTNDVTYPQRDGVRHFSDWYEPRIITLARVVVASTNCCTANPRCECVDVRSRVAQIVRAWSRRCDDAELVIDTGCEIDDPEGDRSMVGPYGVIGRPRVATVQWVGRHRDRAVLTLRFDAVDHRLYILDPSGEPGSGEECVELTPDTEFMCRDYPRCYDMCYEEGGGNGGGPEDAEVSGTLCVRPTIVLNPALTNPVIENLTTGQQIGYAGTIRLGDPPVIIDTATGTATQGGASRTHLLTGSTRMVLDVGTNTLRLISFGASDAGTAEVCWRPATETA